jgi:hypothetical protein
MSFMKINVAYAAVFEMFLCSVAHGLFFLVVFLSCSFGSMDQVHTCVTAVQHSDRLMKWTH